tara:strand:- start:8 stop:436 length:429 start_codon:yes stop_codon:yes gene_type:complete
MAVAFTLPDGGRTVIGNKRVVTGTLAFDASYPTGGEALTPSDLGLAKIDFISISPQDGLVFEYDYTNEKVIVYSQGIRTGATTAADSTSGVFAEDVEDAETAVVVMGGAVNTTYDLGALKQVTSTGDLSTLAQAVRIFVVGR